MRAIQVSGFGGPDRMMLCEVPEPAAAPGQVKIRLAAAGVNPIDTYIRSGTYSFRPGLPYVPGMDGAGVVAECGAGVTAWKSGDRVYVAGSLGTYAESCVAPQEKVFGLPERLTYSQGAALGIPFATAYRALFQIGRLREGESVLIHGASGGVGIAAVQMARACGAFVVGTSGSESGRDAVVCNGAHFAAPHASTSDAAAHLRGIGAGGFDLVIEMLANQNLATDLTLLRPRGRVIVVGSRGPVTINPRDAMSRDASVHGMVILNAKPDELAAAHAAIRAGIEGGTLTPLVAREFALPEAAEAHRLILDSQPLGKLVLLP